MSLLEEVAEEGGEGFCFDGVVGGRFGQVPLCRGGQKLFVIKIQVKESIMGRVYIPFIELGIYE